MSVIDHYAINMILGREDRLMRLMSNSRDAPAADSTQWGLPQALRGEGDDPETIATGYSVNHEPHLIASAAALGQSYLFRLIATASRAVGNEDLQRLLMQVRDRLPQRPCGMFGTLLRHHTRLACTCRLLKSVGMPCSP